MKIIIHFALFFLIFSCVRNQGEKFINSNKYEYVDLTVTHVQNTQVVTFIKNGEPISGTVVQELQNGRKNVWEVEKGLAVKHTMYYSNGQVRRTLELKNGVEHGSFVIYYSNGDKFIEQFYNEGKPAGIWSRWNSEGELIESIEHEQQVPL